MAVILDQYDDRWNTSKLESGISCAMVGDVIFDILPDQRYSKGYGLRYRGHGFEAFKSEYMSYKCEPQMNMNHS